MRQKKWDREETGKMRQERDRKKETEKMIDCMLFHAVFNNISVISQWPVHLSMLSWSSFNQYSAQYSFQAIGCFPTYPLLKQQTAVREEWILSQGLSSILGKNIGWAWSRTSDLLKSTRLLPELWGLAFLK